MAGGHWTRRTDRTLGPAFLRRVRQFEGESCAFSGDGSQIAIRSSEVVQLWDLSQRPFRQLRSIPEKESKVSDSELAFSSDGIVAVVGDRSLRSWNTLEPEDAFAEYKQPDEGSPVHRIAFHPHDALLAAADWNGGLALLDSKSLDVLDYKSEELTMTGWQVKFSTDGDYLVAPCLDQAVKVWKVVADRKLELHRILDGHTYGAVCAAFSQNQHLLAVGCNNGCVTLWDTKTWRQRATLKCYDDDVSVESIAFTADGNALITGGFDGKVKVYQAATHEEIMQAERLDEAPFYLRLGLPQH